MPAVYDISDDGQSTNRLDELIAECLERQDRGEAVDRVQLIRDNPELARGLLEYFDDFDAIEKVASSSRVRRAPNPAEQDSVSLKSMGASTDDEQSIVSGRKPEKTRVLPQQIGKYQILYALGVGGMGMVFLAYDPQLKRKVALKQPHDTGATRQATYARFLIEAQAVAKLRHPNFCGIHEYGEIDGTPYFAMDYIEGTSLSQNCPKTGFANIREAAQIVRAVANAMVAAHAKNVIHRDLKPANIIIDEAGTPIIVDFGLAKEVVIGELSSVTEPGMIVGTLGYMSPEQISGRSEFIGPATDIWSLGIILHELLTGRQPFVGSQTDVMAQILRDPPPKLSELRPEVPPDLEAICNKMLQKSFSDRYKSMAEVVTDLDCYLNPDEWLKDPGFAPSPAMTVTRELVPDALLPALELPAPPQPPIKKRVVTALAVSAAAIVIAAAIFRSLSGAERVQVDIDGIIQNDDDLKVVIKRDEIGAKEIDLDKKATTISLVAGSYIVKVIRVPDMELINETLLVQEGAANSVQLSIESEKLLPLPRPEPFVLDPAWGTFEVPYDKLADIVGFAFSPNSRTLTIATRNGVEIYDPYTRRSWGTLQNAGKPPVIGFNSTSDGRLIAICYETSVEVFDMDSEKLLHKFERSKDAPPHAAFSGDGQLLAAAINAKEVSVRNVGNGEQRQLLTVEPVIGALALNRDGTLMAVIRSKDVSVIDVQTKQQKFVAPHAKGIRAIAFSPDGESLLTAGVESVVNCWSTKNGALLRKITGHASDILSLAVSASGRHLISGSMDRTFRVSDFSTGDEVYLLQNAAPVQNVAFSPDGMTIAIYTEKSISLVTPPAGFALQTGESGLAASLFHPGNGNITATALSPNGRFFAAAGCLIPEKEWDKETKPTIAIWNLSTRTIVHTLRASGNVVKALRYSPDGSKIVSRNSDNLFQMWDAQSGQEMRRQNGAAIGIIGVGEIEDFDFLPNGNLVLVGQSGLQVVDIKTFATKANWPGTRTGGYSKVSAFRNRFAVLLAAHKANEMSQWNISTGIREANWPTIAGFPPELIRIANTGSISLTGSGQFQIWEHRELPPGLLIELAAVNSHTALSPSVAALNSDGTQILLASSLQDSRRQELFVIDSATGKLIKTFDVHTQDFKSACFSTDDRMALTADKDGSVKIWMLPPKVDYDRLAANWILSKGGKVRIQYKETGKETFLKPRDKPPDEPFQILIIDLQGIQGIPAAEFGQISGLSRLYQLNLADTLITAEGLNAISGVPALRALQLKGAEITDTTVQELARFRSLGELGLEGTQITDAGLLKLLPLTSMKHLRLNNTPIGDLAFSYLAGFRDLQSVSLRSTRVTDKGIEAFVPPPRLRSLDCRNTGVTAQGAKALQEKLRGLLVDFQ